MQSRTCPCLLNRFGSGCFKWKLTQTEGVSFLLLFHPVAPAGCNAETAACACVALQFSSDTLQNATQCEIDLV